MKGRATRQAEPDALPVSPRPDDFVDRLEDEVFSDQLREAMEAPVDVPDLTERILAETGRRRGWLGARGRRFLAASRYAIGAGVIAACGLVFALRSSPPADHPARTAPVSALAEALPAETSRVVIDVQRIVTSAAEAAPRARTVTTRGDRSLATIERAARSGSAEELLRVVRLEMGAPVIERAAAVELRASEMLAGVPARVIVNPLADEISGPRFAEVEVRPMLASFGTAAGPGVVSAPALSARARAVLAESLGVAETEVFVMGTRVWIRDAATGRLIEVGLSRPVALPAGMPASVEWQGVVTPASARPATP